MQMLLIRNDPVSGRVTERRGLHERRHLPLGAGAAIYPIVGSPAGGCEFCGADFGTMACDHEYDTQYHVDCLLDTLDAEGPNGGGRSYAKELQETVGPEQMAAWRLRRVDQLSFEAAHHLEKARDLYKK